MVRAGLGLINQPMAYIPDCSGSVNDEDMAGAVLELLHRYGEENVEIIRMSHEMLCLQGCHEGGPCLREKHSRKDRMRETVSLREVIGF